MKIKHVHSVPHPLTLSPLGNRRWTFERDDVPLPTAPSIFKDQHLLWRLKSKDKDPAPGGVNPKRKSRRTFEATIFFPEASLCISQVSPEQGTRDPSIPPKSHTSPSSGPAKPDTHPQPSDHHLPSRARPHQLQPVSFLQQRSGKAPARGCPPINLHWEANMTSRSFRKTRPSAGSLRGWRVGGPWRPRGSPSLW